MPAPDAVERQAHWEQVYATRAVDAVSWFEPEAAQSFSLIQALAPPPAAAVIDIGGGASVLVDRLLDAGYRRPTVLDIADGALAASRRRLGERASRATWVCGDVLDAALPPAANDLWHDRAVFHFLTTPAQRLRYRRQLEHALRPDGYLVIACFAPDGPSRCSGLPVVRYSAATLGAELGPCFMPLQETQVLHTTPAGATQHFLYMSFRYRAT